MEISAQLIKELRERTGVGLTKCKDALEQAKGNIEEAIDYLRKQGMATAVKKESRNANEGIVKTYTSSEGTAFVELNAETDFVVKNENFQKFASLLAEWVALLHPRTLAEFMGMTPKGSRSTIDEQRADLVLKLGEHIHVKRIAFFSHPPNSSIAIYAHMGGKIVTMVAIEGSSTSQDIAKDIAMHIAAEAPEYLSPEEIPAHILDHEKEIAYAQMSEKPAQVQEKILASKLNTYFDDVCLLRQKFVKDPSMTVAALLEHYSKERSSPMRIAYFVRWEASK